MTLGPAIRRAFVVASVCACSPVLRAAAPAPERLLRVVERLDDPRVIRWSALTREPGRFVVWRLDGRVEPVGAVEARVGSHTYRFVDAGAQGAFVVYRLTYEGQAGSVQLLAVATVTEPGLRDASVFSGGVPGPDLLSAAMVWLGPPDAATDQDGAASPAGLRLQAPPEPPPPRS